MTLHHFTPTQQARHKFLCVVLHFFSCSNIFHWFSAFFLVSQVQKLNGSNIVNTDIGLDERSTEEIPLLVIGTKALNRNQMSVCSLFQMSIPPGWSGCLNLYFTEHIIIWYFALPDQTKESLPPRCRWEDGQPVYFSLWFANLYFIFFPSLQSLKQNLQDEAMHNGVKWELFTSLTRRERLHTQTKDSFWTRKLGLSISGISRKTQCAEQSRWERGFKELLCRCLQVPHSWK